MARDETARERDSDRLLDRRSYIKLAGAAAAATAVAGASGSADAAAPNAVSAPADENRSTDPERDDASEDGPADERDPSKTSSRFERPNRRDPIRQSRR